jgi:hypothetical protein
MKRLLSSGILFVAAARLLAGPPELVIYTQDFAVVRETLPLDLRQGENEVRYSNLTEKTDAGSVILRDRSGKAEWHVLEQKLRSSGLTTEEMLKLFEGQTIPFRLSDSSGVREVEARIVRSGRGYGSVTIVELNGKFLWDLPGVPMFPHLPAGASLKPEIIWKIHAPAAVKTEAELLFTTGELNWIGDYNLVAGAPGAPWQLTGWITVRNRSGRAFEDANVKVVAGNVRKVDPERVYDRGSTTERVIVTGSYIPTGETESALPQVSHRKMDEYYEYTVPRPVTLRQDETVQVEFIRTSRVGATQSFVYAAPVDEERSSSDTPLLDPEFGTSATREVVILTEFKNSTDGGLGVPLPAGRIHFYREAQGRLQFTGEAVMQNTPRDEMVRAVSGTAFDLVGERRQLDFRVNEEAHSAEESFEIKLRNQRAEPVEIRVLERAARWRQWEITAKSDEFKKLDARMFEFRVPVKPQEERVLTYTIRYTQFPRGRR